jgi:hypothetical protein
MKRCQVQGFRFQGCPGWRRPARSQRALFFIGTHPVESHRARLPFGNRPSAIGNIP